MIETERIFMRLVIRMLIGLSTKCACNLSTIDEAWKFLKDTKKPPRPT